MSQSENERREDSRKRAREAREGERTRIREIERERERVHANERIEDARGVAGRAATTGRVDGEIQEELKRPSDCWYVPVCRVWGDSKEDAQKDAASPEGSDFAAEEGYEEDGRGPEGSDFAAEEGYEEGGPDAEEGHEEVWDFQWSGSLVNDGA